MCAGEEDQRKVEDLRERMLRNMEMSRERVNELCECPHSMSVATCHHTCIYLIWLVHM